MQAERQKRLVRSWSVPIGVLVTLTTIAPSPTFARFRKIG
jgi:hypothetical protein